MKANGSPLPELDTDDDGTYFLICLPVHQEAVSEKTSEKTSVKTPVKTSGETSVKILSLMSENSQVTTAEIAGTIGKTTRAIEMQVAKLKAEGLVERIGPDKGGYWAVRGEVTVHGSGRRGSATCRVSPPPTPPHNVADLGESVMAASVAATLRGGGHAPTCERLRGEA